MLVDFGEGRRLEQFGGVLVDRPHPAATGLRLSGATWAETSLRYADGQWHASRPLPDPWMASVPLPGGRLTTSLVLHLRPSPSGQVGLFLEHVEVSRWLAGVLEPGDRILSLFAHTGVATLAAAAAGGCVTHVDASRQAIRTARDNASSSELAGSAIRWIHDDCPAFVARLAPRRAIPRNRSRPTLVGPRTEWAGVFDREGSAHTRRDVRRTHRPSLTDRARHFPHAGLG